MASTSKCKKCGSPEDCSCKQQALHISQICNPIDCSTEECTEVFKAECIQYTGPDIICDDVVVVGTNTNVAQALANSIAFFCGQDEITSDIICDNTTIVSTGTALNDAIELIANYFCSEIEGLKIDIQNIQNDITNINNQLITDTSVSVGNVIQPNGCVLTSFTINLLAGVTVIASAQVTLPPICPPEAICDAPVGAGAPPPTANVILCNNGSPLQIDIGQFALASDIPQLCGLPSVEASADTDTLILCRYNGSGYDLYSVAFPFQPQLPPRILSSYNSQTGAGNTGATLNAIIDSVPGNTLGIDGEEFEIDLYLEYNENDPVDLEVGIGTGAVWTRTIIDAEDCKIFIKITIARIDQNNQLWTITETRENVLGTRNISEMEVLYTTKDLFLTENFTVTLVNTGGVAAINALTLHRAVLYKNYIIN
jgi:hypothetical protein